MGVNPGLCAFLAYTLDALSLAYVRTDRKTVLALKQRRSGAAFASRTVPPKVCRQQGRPWQFAVVIFNGNAMTEIPIEAMRGLIRTKEISKVVANRRAKPAIGAVHRALRTATLGDHAMIDRMLLPLDLNRTEDCRVFLNIHLAALINLQADWRLQDRDDFEQMTRCLQHDLRTLGSAVTTPQLFSCTASNLGRGLGIAYVIRGSRLGAGVLRSRVVNDLPTSYLDFVPALSWAAFLLELESVADDSAAKDEATRAARSAFDVFAREFAPLSGALAMPPL